MSLLIKANHSGREIVQMTPALARWKYVGFRALRLSTGESTKFSTHDREYCIVVLAGVVTVTSGDESWREIGKRHNVFEECSPYAVYLPNDRWVKIMAHNDAQVALANAPSNGTHAPRLIEPEQIKRSTRGQGLNTRYVCDILPETEPADSLLVVEVITPSGHASSYPPHKHDSDNIPVESVLEEIYYHRLNPSQGFAFQRVYTDDRTIDEAMAVENHDVVMVPRGYHPVVAPYGYDSYYLNVMAGPKRQWYFKNDPAHEWMLNEHSSH